MNTEAGIVKIVKKKRSCLMCGNMFTSAGSFNRRCKACEKQVVLRKKDYYADSHIHKVSNKSAFDAFDNSNTINS